MKLCISFSALNFRLNVMPEKDVYICRERGAKYGKGVRKGWSLEFEQVGIGEGDMFSAS